MAESVNVVRAQVVEAMAQAMSGLTPEEWETAEEAEREIWLMQASAALDAALDVLGEFVQELDSDLRFTITVPGFLAVLRAGKGSE